MRPIRSYLWVVAGLLLVAAAIGLAQLVDERRVRRELEQRLTALVGRTVTIRDPLEYRLLPPLAFDLRGIEVAGVPRTAAPLLAIARASGSVRAAALVRGRLEIGAVRLDGVRLALAVDAAGRRNWDGLFPARTIAADAPAAEPLHWTLDSLTLVNGAASYQDARAGRDYALRDVVLTLGRIELPRPFEVSARARLYDGVVERARLALGARAAVDAAAARYAVEQPVLDATLLRAPAPSGAPAAIKVALRAQRIDYAGAAGGSVQLRGLDAAALGMRARIDLLAESLAGAPRAAGVLAVAPFAPRGIATALAVELPPMRDANALGRASLTSHVAYDGGVVRLQRIEAGLDDTRLTGDVEVALAPRAYHLELEADHIVADRYLKPERLRDRTPVELPLDFLRALPVAGRLRVDELEVAGTRLAGVTIDLGAAARDER